MIKVLSIIIIIVITVGNKRCLIANEVGPHNSLIQSLILCFSCISAIVSLRV